MSRLARMGLCALLMLCLVLSARAGDDSVDDSVDNSVDNTQDPVEKKDIVYEWTITDKYGEEVTPNEYQYKLPEGEYKIQIYVDHFKGGDYSCGNLALDWTGEDGLKEQLDHAGLTSCYPNYYDSPEGTDFGAPAGGDDKYGGYIPLDDYCTVSFNCTVDCSYPVYDCGVVNATIVEIGKKDENDMYTPLSPYNFPETIASVSNTAIEICTDCPKECELPYGKYTCDSGNYGGSYDYEKCLYDSGKCVDCHMEDCYNHWVLTCTCPTKCPKGYKEKGYEGYAGKGYTGKEYSSKTYKGSKDNKYRCNEERHIDLVNCKSGAVGWDKKNSKLTCLPKGNGYGYTGPGYYYGKNGAYYKAKYGGSPDYQPPSSPKYGGKPPKYDKPAKYDKPPKGSPSYPSSPEYPTPSYEQGGDPTYDKPSPASYTNKQGKRNNKYQG